MRAVVPAFSLLLLLLLAALRFRPSSAWLLFVDDSVQPAWTYNTSQCILGDDAPVDPVDLNALQSWSFHIDYDRQSTWDQMWLSSLSAEDRQGSTASSAFCAALFDAPPGITFNASTPDHCNYTMAWTGVFASPALAVLFNSSSLGSGSITPGGTPEPSSKAVSVALIAGVVGGVVIILACILACTVYMLCRATQPSSHNFPSSFSATPSPSSTLSPGFVALTSPTTSLAVTPSSSLGSLSGTTASLQGTATPDTNDRTMITTAHDYNYRPQSWTYHNTGSSLITSYTYPDAAAGDVPPIKDTPSIVKVWSEPGGAEKEEGE